MFHCVVGIYGADLETHIYSLFTAHTRNQSHSWSITQLINHTDIYKSKNTLSPRKPHLASHMWTHCPHTTQAWNLTFNLLTFAHKNKHVILTSLVKTVRVFQIISGHVHEDENSGHVCRIAPLGKIRDCALCAGFSVVLGQTEFLSLSLYNAFACITSKTLMNHADLPSSRSTSFVK